MPVRKAPAGHGQLGAGGRTVQVNDARVIAAPATLDGVDRISAGAGRQFKLNLVAIRSPRTQIAGARTNTLRLRAVRNPERMGLSYNGRRYAHPGRRAAQNELRIGRA